MRREGSRRFLPAIIDAEKNLLGGKRNELPHYSPTESFKKAPAQKRGTGAGTGKSVVKERKSPT
jgi:hypothetical protein